MSYIPNCRTDEIYNEKNLNNRDKEHLLGFDWCTEMAVDNFFNNLDVYFDSDSYLMHLLNERLPKDMQEEYEMEYTYADDENKSEMRKTETYADMLRFKILDWIEMERNELITSMIDNASDDF